MRPFVMLAALCLTLAVTTPFMAVAQSAAQAATRRDTAGMISGAVVVKGTRDPLPYASVSLPDLHIERFADANGLFTFQNVPAGHVAIRVRRIGFTAVDLDVDVAVGKTTTTRVELDRVVIRLDAVSVTSHPPCTRPGRPSAKADKVFFPVFDQLMQNADRNRLLLEEYPYRTFVERTIATQAGGGVTSSSTVDTIIRTSGRRWQYAPGQILVQQPHGTISYYGFTSIRRIEGPPIAARNPPSTYDLVVPDLTDFANDVFVANHCFWYAGEDVVGGTPLIHIEFAPAERINDPDVEGAIYLDPETYIIRRSVIRLTKIPKSLDRVGELTVTSVFSEILPGVPAINDISSVTSARDSAGAAGAVSSTELQHLLSVSFLKGRP